MASNMYAFHKQTHPPTGVEHCLYCNFYNMEEHNLIVAQASHLKVFRLVPEAEVSDKLGENDKQPKLKLECTQSFSLHGNIMSLQAVRLTGSPRNALLLSFQEAKLSVVEYDPSTHDLKTLSLHYFEDYDMKGGFTQHYQIPFVRVDPEGRCAAMMVYGKNLVILPFRKESATEDQDSSLLPGSKSSVLASYTIKLSELDEKVDNIIDLQFLHGYYEPTLLILFEPLKTWPGRVAVRQDTCSMISLSLNIHEKVHPVIWSLSSLPYDCTQALAVPKPIGGVLIFAVNSLLYLNQSVPPYGVSLNSFTEHSTAFPLKPQDGVKISLDCAQGCFISYDKLVISLKGGELYVLTLFNDGMRSVRNFSFDRAAASVLTTCMTICEEGYLFLGSRLGNSLLLRYMEKVKDTTAEENKTEDKNTPGEPPTKRKKLETLGDWMASDVALIEDPDELEVYGTAMQATKQLTAFTFEVCDSLLNIAPCGQISMGEPAFLSEEFSGNPDPDVELVSTAGYGKNGALCILQRSVRPQVVTTFELPGCVDMWTVVAPPESPVQEVKEVEDNKEKDQEKKDSESTDEAKKDEQNLVNTHAFLILSRLDSSMILQTGQEINELDHSGFSTQASTVYAGNIGNNRYILQVSPMGVRLLEGVKQLQHIPLDVGSPIVLASIADPYVIIMSAEGLAIQLTLRQEHSVFLGVSRPMLAAGKSKIVTLCLYKDISGLFNTAPRQDINEEVQQKVSSARSTEIRNSFTFETSGVDDEDELLYGDSTNKDGDLDSAFPLPSVKSPSVSKIFEVIEVKPTYWLFVVRENGVLEIYSLPDYKLCYLVKNFPMGQKVLVDSVQMTLGSGVGTLDKQQDKQHEAMPLVHEILMVGLGIRQSRPILLARVDEELLIYEAFPFYETQTENHLKLRFKKLSHGIILKERRMFKARRKPEAVDQEKVIDRHCSLRYYGDISGYSGVFICGPYPHWLFMTTRGELRSHPMGIDGGVSCFAPFHNVNCPKGFLYFNKQDELRICVLPTHLSYDAPWPVRKVPLRSTPHFVSYHLESKTYCVVTSTMTPCSYLVRLNGDEKEYEVLERDERFIYPTIDKFSLQLFSPVSWDVIPNTKMELEDWEHVSCLKNVNLASEGTHSGLKGYLAIGTNYNYGEDVTSRGRIFILDVIDVVPEPGQPLTKNKIKVVYCKEQKGPVTAICQVGGFLLSAIGQKVYIWQLKNNDLAGVAFIDTQIYIHLAISIKNLILVGDFCKSVSLLRYQEESRTLSLVSRDVKPLEVFGIEFFVDNTQLGFLVTDSEKNLVLYMYQPEARESCGGHRLLRKADFHVGSSVMTMFRIRCRIGDMWNVDRRQAAIIEKRHITMYATLDGSLGFVLPVPEKTYRRLLMLQNVLVTHIPHTAGLNPKAFRIHRSHRRFLVNPHKNVLDGDLLWKFLNLSVLEKTELAKKIGTTTEQITEDIVEISRYTAHF